MSSYAQLHQRKRRFTESATAYKTSYSDHLSSEYTASGIIPGLRTDQRYEPTQKRAVEDDLRRAVKAQERARARKAVHDSSPRRIAVLASIPPVPPMPQNTSLYPSTAQMDGFSFPSNDVLVSDTDQIIDILF
ncbi:hypothetical protein AAF712_000650 [Marasmius tenuissimus]|uniref:Uncharacterized protein n=1 Tax=Marasmius tenuissimus TaxID=585030 RepID=A0ABR3ADD2_9AGAR